MGYWTIQPPSGRSTRTAVKKKRAVNKRVGHKRHHVRTVNAPAPRFSK